MRWFFCVIIACALVAEVKSQQAFKLKPAVAIEAEDFTVESGWKVIHNGHGNYMVDFNAN